MKKVIIICLLALLMVACRSKKVVVQDQYRVEMKDSTVKREVKKAVEVLGTDTSKVESQVEEVMVFHFTDSGGSVEVLPDGSLRMQGISSKTKTDDVYLDSVGKKEQRHDYSHNMEKKQPPDRWLYVIPIFLLVALAWYVFLRFRR